MIQFLINNFAYTSLSLCLLFLPSRFCKSCWCSLFSVCLLRDYLTPKQAHAKLMWISAKGQCQSFLHIFFCYRVVCTRGCAGRVVRSMYALHTFSGRLQYVFFLFCRERLCFGLQALNYNERLPTFVIVFLLIASLFCSALTLILFTKSQKHV